MGFNSEMDNSKLAKVPDDSNKYEIGDVDIFLFSNGQVYSPPRKYHLKAEELNFWESTKNFLARSHFGYMHSTIDLYTTDGQKIESPLELANNTAYVAVEPKEEFLPGGYDQYLMKASKSWIKRYGEMNINNSSTEKLNENAVKISGISKNNSPPNEVQEADEKATVPAAELFRASEIIKKSVEIPIETTIPKKNTFLLKQPEKKKNSTQRSSILRKNSSKQQSNDKKSSPPPASKRKTSPPPKKYSLNKIPPQPKKDSLQSKTILSRTKNMSSQFGTIPPITTNVTPAFIIPAKLSIKSDTQNPQNESITNENIPPVQDVDLINPAISSNNDMKQENAKPSEYDSDQKVFETLETIIENVNSNNDVQSTNNRVESKVIEPFSTFMNVGDVINLRLSIELKNNITDNEISKKANITMTVPLTNHNEHYNGPTEKSSQVNMDEVGAQNEIMKNILDDLNKNETSQKYVIFNCNCCHSNMHATNKQLEKMKYEVKNINNKDYIIFLPSTNHDENFFRCKCDDAIPKFDKYVQTSIILENVECLNVASTIKNVDQITHVNKTSTDVKTVSQHQSAVSVTEPFRQKSVLFDNIAIEPLEENHITNTECQGCSNISRENEIEKCKEKVSTNSLCSKCTSMHKDMNTNDTSSKENQVISSQIYDCANTPKETVMADKSTQTDSHCLLLEARRQKDGHFSFHLPPLQMVKLYQK